ncbi:hypothetical protein BDK51DRAFT_47511 [Blyttiomyces helicus]|uniref:Uncharacterized protein n=1 Tax=Blyttiomyces helicus TaxID=388810 RepID=A0A4P9W888_9FUNG|nr:hypothetical protein BDK51DRAFT_47511 [Blyttiomyces helicus]|eukprot:RKO86376.1 hypothetical protein BDK51DRAFT_47511 [Blyttiomyces helicus]
MTLTVYEGGAMAQGFIAFFPQAVPAIRVSAFLEKEHLLESQSLSEADVRATGLTAWVKDPVLYLKYRFNATMRRFQIRFAPGTHFASCIAVLQVGICGSSPVDIPSMRFITVSIMQAAPPAVMQTATPGVHTPTPAAPIAALEAPPAPTSASRIQAPTPSLPPPTRVSSSPSTASENAVEPPHPSPHASPPAPPTTPRVVPPMVDLAALSDTQIDALMRDLLVDPEFLHLLALGRRQLADEDAADAASSEE